ncbi:MAG: hypothetical protein ACI9GZ_001102 [Bacteroidia bacterium]|jgi:hypothetical protein
MKVSIKNSTLVLAITSSILMSCQKDEIVADPDELQIGQFETEVFEDMTIADLQSLETPFETQMNAAIPSSGRTSTGSTTFILAVLLDVLEGATFKSIEDDEERGLASYRIKLRLSDESILEIVISKDVFEILEIVGYGGAFEYDIDPESNFISLKEAFEKAKVAQSGDVVHWELELEEDNKWEYEIHIENDLGRFEIEVDAFTGKILGINELDEDDKKEFETEKEDEDEKDEKESQKLPENIKNTLLSITGAKLVYAEREEGDSDERDIWNIYVETESEAIIYLEITDDTEDLIYAKGDKGPFDYDIILGGNFISLKEALIRVNDEMQSETYYWYYEQIVVEEKEHWAFIIKVKDNKGVYHKIAIDAITMEWLHFETFD